MYDPRIKVSSPEFLVSVMTIFLSLNEAIKN